MEVNLKVEPSETRGNEFIADLSITNITNDKVTVSGISTIGTTGLEIEKATLAIGNEDISEFRELCGALEAIANKKIIQGADDVRREFHHRALEGILRVFQSLGSFGFLTSYFLSVFSKNSRKYFEKEFVFATQPIENWIAHDSLALKIRSVSEAKYVRALIVELEDEANSDNYADTKRSPKKAEEYSQADLSFKIFDEKLRRLKVLEKAGKEYGFVIGDYPLHPGESVHRKYLIKAPRKALNRASYTFGFRCDFTLDDEVKVTKERTDSVSVSANIWMLTFMSAASAALGSFVKLVYDVDSHDKCGASSVFSWQSCISPDEWLLNLLTPAIMAGIIFNFYEHTDLMKDVPRTISWRTAIFFGFLTGLFATNILAGLKAVLGT